MGYKILSGRYCTGKPHEKEKFIQIFGEVNTQEKFELYFQWFNIIHMLAHILIREKKLKMDRVQEEILANSIAAAYWREVDGMGHMSKVEETVKGILCNLNTQVDNIKSFHGFFEKIKGMESKNTEVIYGYFQVACTLEGLKQKKSFVDILKYLGYEISQGVILEKYQEEALAENAPKVMENWIRNMKKLGIEMECGIELILVDNPKLQTLE